MDELVPVVRSALRAAVTRAAKEARRAFQRVQSLGTYRAGESVQRVPVPGTRRTVPLYMLVPGATHGLAVLTIRAALVFAATLASIAAVWAYVGVARGILDSAAAVGLTGLSVAVWLIALFAVEWSWASRPKQRPLSSDVARW